MDLTYLKKYLLRDSDKFSLTLILFLNVIGILLVSQSREVITNLTAPMLLLQLGLLLFVLRRHLKLILVLLALVGFFGFSAEVIGVNTGLIFGDYKYGEVLGLALFNVPILISVNWFLVTFCATSMAFALKQEPKKIALLSSIFVVVYDFILERFATKFGLWQWMGGIPAKNYITWFILSFIFSVVILRYTKVVRHMYTSKYVQWLLPIHIAFFVIAMGIQ